jgi:hypothetical protein
MLGSRRWPERAWLWACGVAWLSASGCSGPTFASGANGGSSGASTNGGTDSAGDDAGGSDSGATGGTSDAGGSATAGTADVGGSAGSGGSGGSGGSDVTPGCNCAPGQYCRAGSTDCVACTELNRLRFTPPERLDTLSDNGQGSNFPRVGRTATDLVFVFNGTGLRYTTDSSTSAGSSVKGTQAQDNAPLLLREPVPGPATLGLEKFDFLFDRVTTKRVLYVGSWVEGTDGAVKLTPPFNGAGTSSDYSIAVALHPGAGPARAFWMSTRDAPDAPRLHTALVQDGAAALPVDLRLAKDIPNPDPMGTPTICPTSDHDLAPWVTSDGKTLVFSHTRVDANCKAVSAQKRDIYTTLLQPATGQPPTGADDAIVPATPLNDVNSSADDIEPSFSADMCDLYFSSNRDGKFAVYRAHRK